MSLSLNVQNEFNLHQEHHWFNAASEGPLPQVAYALLQQAGQLKQSVYRLSLSHFHTVPLELKRSLAQILGAQADDIILGNSASYGMHILANGLPLEKGDEVLTMLGDFPTNILPWLPLSDHGVIVKQIATDVEGLITVDDLINVVTNRTKVLCISHVHSFTGEIIDWPAIYDFCEKKGVWLIVNVAQSLGVMPINMEHFKAHAVIGAGYKWLLGPYGTGFMWIPENMRSQLKPSVHYWITSMSEGDFNSTQPLQLKSGFESRRWDVFGTANFFNFMPWKGSIDFLLGLRLENIQAHNALLIDHFINGLDRRYFDIISPQKHEVYSPICVFSASNSDLNKSLHEKLIARGFYLALWKNRLRLSPHVYNNLNEIDLLLEVIHENKS